MDCSVKSVNVANSLSPLLIFSSIALAGCDWVDSAGSTQSDGIVPADPVAVVEVFNGDVPLNDQGAGSIFKLTEATSNRIVTTIVSDEADQPTFRWSDSPVEQGRLADCLEPGFFEENANIVDSLEQACTEAENCNLSFESQSGSDQGPEFILEIPVLKSSVGVVYELEIDDANNQPLKTRYQFCLIAANESPDASPDTFVVIEGQRLEVTENGRNLLSNDTDDIDETNKPLRVLPEPLANPENAAVFELGSNGNFVYESSLSGLREDGIDSFVYQVTDDVTQPSSARVTIRIVARNLAPVVEREIPLIEAAVGRVFEEDLSEYFTDPEGNDISFSVSEDSVLPPSGSVSLTVDGVLAGTPQRGDAGDYVLTILASDGVSQVTPAVVSLNIASIPLVNSAPQFVAGSVGNRSVREGRRMAPIEPLFTDRDGDTLTFTMVGGARLPAGISLDAETGVVSGIATARGSARNLRIRATDISEDSAVSGFFNIFVFP